MRVLVIGGTGFIGAHVVRRLAELGHAVTVYHRGEHEAEIPKAVRHVHDERAGYPVRYYAGETMLPSPDVVLHMTLMGEEDARLAMRTFGGVAKRIVAVSSADVYRAYGVLNRTESGPLEPVPIDEQAPVRTVLYPYRAAAPDEQSVAYHYEKILVERAVLGSPSFPGTVLRLPAVYGPGDPQRRFLPYVQRMRDGRAAIPLPASMAAWRWTHGYVENVAAAIVLAVVVDAAANRIYNVGEAATPTVEERVAALAAAAGWHGRIRVLPDDRFPPHLRDTAHDFRQHLVTDTSRIRADLGHTDPVPDADALARTIAWERAQPPSSLAADRDYAAEDALLATEAE